MQDDGGPRVELREITYDTLVPILRLKVAESQRGFVAQNAVSIAEAYYKREEAWFRGIYAADEPVGFLMLSDEPDKACYSLWRFMIGEEHQGKGFGRRALELLIEHVRGRPGATELSTSIVEGEGSPRGFYESLGFRATGEIEDGETVLRLEL